MQYSKRFAIAALITGTAAYLLAWWQVGSDPEWQYRSLIALLEYTFGIVALYNGNSVSEKYFTSKFHLFAAPDEEKDESGTNG